MGAAVSRTSRARARASTSLCGCASGTAHTQRVLIYLLPPTAMSRSSRPPASDAQSGHARWEAIAANGGEFARPLRDGASEGHHDVSACSPRTSRPPARTATRCQIGRWLRVGRSCRHSGAPRRRRTRIFSVLRNSDPPRYGRHCGANCCRGGGASIRLRMRATLQLRDMLAHRDVQSALPREGEGILALHRHLAVSIPLREERP